MWGPSYHGDLEDRRKSKHLGNGDPVIIPGRDIVTEPMANFRSRASKGTSRDDHGSLVGSST